MSMFDRRLLGQKNIQGEYISFVHTKRMHIKRPLIWESPLGLVVRILGFHYYGLGSMSGQGNKTPQAGK